MTTIAAFLLVCATNADRDVASAVHAAAVHAGVDPAFALAVAAVESCATGPNPLGVRGCKRDCIAIGARSLVNRLRGCNGDERCAARRFRGHRHANAAKYAAKVLKIARFVRDRSKR